MESYLNGISLRLFHTNCLNSIQKVKEDSPLGCNLRGIVHFLMSWCFNIPFGSSFVYFQICSLYSDLSRIVMKRVNHDFPVP